MPMDSISDTFQEKKSPFLRRTKEEELIRPPLKTPLDHIHKQCTLGQDVK